MQSASTLVQAEPGVLQGLLGCEALRWSSTKELLQEILGLMREVLQLWVLEYHQVLHQNVLEYFISCMPWERQLAREAHVHDDAERPNVTGCGDLAIDNLRSDVERSSAAQ